MQTTQGRAWEREEDALSPVSGRYYLYLLTRGKMNFKPYHDSGHLYFVTGTIIQWLKLFNEKCYLDIILQALEWHRNNQKMKVFAFDTLENAIYRAINPLPEMPNRSNLIWQNVNMEKIGGTQDVES